MTAIKMICYICKEKFWGSGFDHICYKCACGQPIKVYEAKLRAEVHENYGNEG